MDGTVSGRKTETDEQKALREENEKLRAKQYEMLAARIAACCRMLRLLLAQNPFIFVCAKSARPGLQPGLEPRSCRNGNERLAKGGKPV